MRTSGGLDRLTDFTSEALLQHKDHSISQGIMKGLSVTLTWVWRNLGYGLVHEHEDINTRALPSHTNPDTYARCKPG